MNEARRPFTIGVDDQRGTTVRPRARGAETQRRSRPAGLALVLVASCLVASGAASWSCRRGYAADAVPPPAPQTSTSPAADQPAVPFRPQELSIGEPISLPNATPLQPSRMTSAPSPLPPSPGRLPAAATPTAGAAGTGWLGLAVDDTLVTGRLVVVEVAADSPAATAGVRQQDVLLAINGAPVQTADEMAAALAAIAPGQRVNVAVGRDSRVDDLVLTAVSRPAEARARNWQSTDAGETASAPPRSVLTSGDALPQPATLPPSMQPPAAASAPAMTTAPAMTSGPAMSGPPVALPAPPAPFGVTTVPMPGSPVAGGPVSAAAAVPAVGAPAIPAPPALTASATFQPAVPSPPAVAAGLPVAAQPAPASAPQLLPRQSSAPAAHAGGRLALGVRTVPVDPAVQSRFQMADTRGAYVIGVVESLPAARAGVPPGSVIVALNQQPVRSPQDLTQMVTHGPAGTPVTLEYVLPGGQARQASVVLQSLDEPLERALVGDAPVLREPGPWEPGPRPVAAAPLQSAPQVARRPEVVAATRAADDGQTIVRLEAAIRRMTEQLERLDRRLQQFESRR